MINVESRYHERTTEIHEYLNFLDNIEQAIQKGTPKISSPNGIAITTTQQKILFSSVYLQLYNLIESTVAGCIEAVSEAINSQNTLPENLSKKMLAEWVRNIAGTNKALNEGKQVKVYSSTV